MRTVEVGQGPARTPLEIGKKLRLCNRDGHPYATNHHPEKRRGFDSVKKRHAQSPGEMERRQKHRAVKAKISSCRPPLFTRAGLWLFLCRGPQPKGVWSPIFGSFGPFANRSVRLENRPISTRRPAHFDPAPQGTACRSEKGPMRSLRFQTHTTSWASSTLGGSHLPARFSMTRWGTMRSRWRFCLRIVASGVSMAWIATWAS